MSAHALRIFENISILLRTGHFAGEAAPAITEALSLVEQMIAETKKVQDGVSSSGDAQDPTRLADGEVLPEGRKGRARRKK